ncbi:hypothetical protein AAC387_Pa05g0157 [Persea americana]
MDMAFSGELAYETSVENEGNFCFTMMHEPNHFRKLRNRTSAELQNKMRVPAAILFREMHKNRGKTGEEDPFQSVGFSVETSFCTNNPQGGFYSLRGQPDEILI